MKYLKEMISKLAGRLTDKKSGTGLILALGFAGILLIMVSCFTGSENDDERSGAEKDVRYAGYTENTERRLEEILGKIKGVGKVSVMICTDSTEETVYEQDIKESISGEKGSRQSENSVVIVQNNGDRKALVKKTVNPHISGVVVVCSGGKSSAVRERILSAVSAALGTDTNRICIEEYGR